MEVLHHIFCTFGPALPFDLVSPIVQPLGADNLSHDLGGQPPKGGAGVHSGRPTLLFKLLSHA
jgi:hypothetical protein